MGGDRSERRETFIILAIPAFHSDSEILEGSAFGRNTYMTR
jgi:hypothetical protein